MKFYSFSRSLLILLLCVAFGANAFAKKGIARVLVDSWARPDYEEEKMTDDGPKLETYHILEGKHFGGYIADKSLGKVTFQELVDNLAVELRQRNYYPAKSKEMGDFLIVVHWGVTGVEDDWEELFPSDADDGFGTGEDLEGGEEDDFGSDTDFGFSTSRETGTEYSDAKNANLIGFDRALNRRGLMPQDEYELRDMLRDERYFIVLMAFDWQKLIKDKKLEKVWSTRFSLDSIGTNFVDAHYALSRAAAPHFGTETAGKLAKERTDLGPGEVEIKELEVVETIESEEAKE